MILLVTKLIFIASSVNKENALVVTHCNLKIFSQGLTEVIQKTAKC